MWTGPKKEMHDELYKRLGTKKEKSALSRLVRQRDRVGEKMRQRKRDRDTVDAAGLNLRRLSLGVMGMDQE